MQMEFLEEVRASQRTLGTVEAQLLEMIGDLENLNWHHAPLGSLRRIAIGRLGEAQDLVNRANLSEET